MSKTSTPRPGGPLSERVKRSIRSAGVTNPMLIAALGLSATSVAKRLRGETEWRATELHVVAGLCDMTIGELLSESPDPRERGAALVGVA